jgi:uncharacterized phage-associated protein
MHSAIAVANHFVQSALSEQARDLPGSKIHGLVYIAHGWRLGASAQPLISSRIMACRDGILIPELREAGCWGARNVTQPISVYATDPARGVMTEQTPLLPPGDPVAPVLAWVWKTYGKMAGYRIAEHIKELGGPWDLIWNDEERPDDEPKPIPNTTIKLWFRGLSARREAQARGDVSATQRPGLKPKLEETQQLLARPDPNRLRSF